MEYYYDGITIIMPCYNEQDRLSVTIQDIVNVQKEIRLNKLIVVDDGSTDSTVERAQHFKDKLPLEIVRYETNKGKWGAIHEGIKHVEKGWILLMDADGSASISQLQRVPGWKNGAWKERGDVVYSGSRFLPKSIVDGKSVMRNVVSHVYRVYARSMFRYATGKSSPHDTQCPFKLFKKEWLSGRENLLVVNRFAGDVELLAILDKPIISFPIYFEHCKGSKIKSSTAYDMFIETYQVAKRVRKARRQL